MGYFRYSLVVLGQFLLRLSNIGIDLVDINFLRNDLIIPQLFLTDVPFNSAFLMVNFELMVSCFHHLLVLVVHYGLDYVLGAGVEEFFSDLFYAFHIKAKRMLTTGVSILLQS